ncbi:MAG: DUF4259 domain-containing protein, partial [Chloroflexota bacterium]
MGAWGTGIFDNDTACDWAYELENSSDLSVISSTINAVFNDDYIDSDVACDALAAIDTLARLKGQHGVKNVYTEIVDNWVEKTQMTPPPEMIEKALSAIKLILGNSSELCALWSESEQATAWKEEINSL